MTTDTDKQPDIRVGDRVHYKNGDPNYRATVKAIDGDEAWVRWDHGGLVGNITENVSSLLRAPAPKEGE